MSFMCNERNTFVILQQHMKYTLSRIKWRKIMKRRICLSFSLLYLFICSWKCFITETRAYDVVTDSCRDWWNARNYSSSHVQVFRDRRSVQIDDVHFIETGRFIAQMKQLKQPFFRLTVRMFWHQRQPIQPVFHNNIDRFMYFPRQRQVYLIIFT